MRLPRLAATTALAAVIASAGTAQAAPEPGRADHSRPDAPAVWAHRGSSKTTPEETFAAYRQALADGTDVLEGDIAQTKDGQLILIHDDTLARTTNVEEVFPDRAPWNVRDFTLAEIKRLDAGSWFDPAYAGEKVPTVREWIAFNGGRAGLAPEIKNPDLYPGIVEKVAAELRHWGYTRDLKARNGAPLITVQSFSEPALRELDAALPEVPLYVLISNQAYMTASDDVLTELATWADFVSGNAATTRASQVSRVQSFGLQVVSLHDSPELIEMAVDQGYDVAFTNVPAVAKSVLAGKDPFRGHGDVVIDTVEGNPEGDDVASGGGEYVALRNTTDRKIDLTGYTLREFGNAVLRVADGAVLEPGGRYIVYVGPGTDRPDAHFNGRAGEVLANSGTDHVYLYNPRSTLVGIVSYIVP